MGNQYNDDEVEIDLGSMFAAILRRWKMILVAIIVAAVTAGGIGCYAGFRENAGRYSDESLAAVQDKLTQSQIAMVDQLYERYKAYRNKIDDNQRYLANSILMNLDPNNISTQKVEYLVTSDQENVVNSFAGLTLGMDDYQAIADSLGTDVDTRYIYEVVNIAALGSSDNADEVNVTSDAGKDLWKGGTITNGYRQLMDVTIVAQSKEHCEAIADIVDAALKAQASKLQAAGVTLTLSVVGDNYTESVSTALANQQQAAIAQGSTLMADYNDFTEENIDTLDADKADYFNFLIKRDDDKEEDIHWKRYAAIGALTGLLAALVIAIAKYLTSGGFHTAEEFTKSANVPLLGVLHSSGNYRLVDAAFHRAADRIEFGHLPRIGTNDTARLGVIAARLKELCGQEENSSIYLVQNYSLPYAKDVAEKLCALLKNEGLRVSLGNPLTNADEFTRLTTSGNAVLLCALEDGRRADLEQIVKICEESGVKLQGGVAIART
ncbi:hypothetical protein SAMN02745687_02510 [Lachnospiraceae bacterium NK3A20]|nr:hypothetical protein SAMN02745687_02510 [Lachnospiraceae bacterium NK3A20]